MSQYSSATEARSWFRSLAERVLARQEVQDASLLAYVDTVEALSARSFYEQVAAFLFSNPTNGARVRLYEVAQAAAEAAGSQERFEQLEEQAANPASAAGAAAAEALKDAAAAVAAAGASAAAAAGDAVAEELGPGGLALGALFVLGLALAFGRRR